MCFPYCRAPLLRPAPTKEADASTIQRGEAASGSRDRKNRRWASHPPMVVSRNGYPWKSWLYVVFGANGRCCDYLLTIHLRILGLDLPGRQPREHIHGPPLGSYQQLHHTVCREQNLSPCGYGERERRRGRRQAWASLLCVLNRRNHNPVWSWSLLFENNSCALTGMALERERSGVATKAVIVRP